MKDTKKRENSMIAELDEERPDRINFRVDGQVWAHLKIYYEHALSSHIPEVPYRLSRYASLVTSRNKDWCLISPLAVGQLVIDDVRIMRLLYSLPDIPPEFEADVVAVLMRLLVQAGFLDDQDNAYAAWWSAQELMYVVNTSADLRALQPPIAPFKPPMSEDVVGLPEIAPDAWKDASFAHVVRERRSRYAYAETPITLAQLSEFLTRTLRSHGEVKGRTYDTTVRWYPSAGAAYELEAYLAVYQCAGLDAGFYHYHPANHALERLSIDDSVRQKWNEDLSASTGHQLQSKPQILFFFTARMGRLQNKSRGIALAYTNLGVVEQSLYLTATAMNLAPCALGGWPAKNFAQQTGIPLAEEALVGQFLLGSTQDVRKD
jgi:SagB-type dehydrogenase family enzyme